MPCLILAYHVLNPCLSSHSSLYSIYPARAPLVIKGGKDRSKSTQAGMQFAALVVSLAISIVGGLITGILKGMGALIFLYYYHYKILSYCLGMVHSVIIIIITRFEGMF